MNLTHKTLSTGYHFVRDANARMYAQWEIGKALTVWDTSLRGADAETTKTFILKASAIAKQYEAQS